MAVFRWCCKCWSYSPEWSWGSRRLPWKLSWLVEEREVKRGDGQCGTKTSGYMYILFRDIFPFDIYSSTRWLNHQLVHVSTVSALDELEKSHVALGVPGRPRNRFNVTGGGVEVHGVMLSWSLTLWLGGILMWIKDFFVHGMFWSVFKHCKVFPKKGLVESSGVSETPDIHQSRLDRAFLIQHWSKEFVWYESIELQRHGLRTTR